MSNLPAIGSASWIEGPGVRVTATLHVDWTFSAEVEFPGDRSGPLPDAGLAEVLTAFYRMPNPSGLSWISPSLGYPGHAILADLAGRNGGRVDIEPIPGPGPGRAPTPPGMIY